MNRDIPTKTECIETAGPGDTDRLVQLINSAYRGDESRKGWTTEADFLEDRRIEGPELKSLLLNPAAMILKMTQGPEIVACAYLEKRLPAAYIGMLSVKPTLQSQGIAKRVLARAEDIVKNDWRLDAIEMKVISIREELIAYYARRGYAVTGEREPFPYDKLKPGQAKRNDLEFTVLRKLL